MNDDVILERVEPEGGYFTAWPNEIGIIMRGGEITDVFSEGERSVDKGMFSKGKIRTYKAYTAPFNLTFWLKDPGDASEPDEGVELDGVVLTPDKQLVTGQIGIIFSVVQERVDLLLRMDRGAAVRKSDVADAIKGELLAKVLAMNIRGHTAGDLRGNRDLFRGIHDSLRVELASTISRYGLSLDDFYVSWGLTPEERERIKEQRHIGTIRDIEREKELEDARKRKEPGAPKKTDQSAFHVAMLNVYHEARSVGHEATRFLQMVTDLGGVETARRLLRSRGHSYGLKKLGELGRLDISMEALVLEERWRPLFTDEERRVAQARLEELGYFGENEWRSLPELQPESGATHPAEMLFPDGRRAELTAWASIQREAVRWLIDHRMLNAPVPGRARGKLLVNTRPVHSDGSPFPESSEVNGWFVSMGMDALDIIRRTNHIIEYVGQAPAQFKVRSPSK